jgi:hypothetical protein
MKTFKGDFKILNEYQASSKKNITLGADHSFDYAMDKGIMLYIADDTLKTTVSFKAFLKDFSLSTTVNLKKTALVVGKQIETKSIGIIYSVSLSIPALSVNDARINAARLEELDRIVGTGAFWTNQRGNSQATERPKRVLLANLIHNGLYRKKHEIQYFSQVKKYGVKCFFFGNSYSIDVGMGFFEYKGKLWPKVYDLQLQLNVDSAFDDESEIIRGFNPDQTAKTPNYYETSDVRSWPFGVY